jgi:GT2 family glycosyltransferase
LSEKNAANEPKVMILFTTYKDPPLFKDILESIKHTEYSDFELLVIDCSSTKTHQALETAELAINVQYVALEKDQGAAYQLNEGMHIALSKDVKYIVRLEGDAIPLHSHWLQELVNVMENDNTIAIAMPFDVDRNGRIGYGGRLYGNGTYCLITQPQTSKIVPCLGTGGHCFITRKTYIEELFEEGIKPYWTPFYISSEDLDFNLKAWLRSYRVVTVGSVRVLHEGTSMPKNQSYRAPYRVYHTYKNRLCLLLLNFGYRHILVNVPYRLLNDVFSAFVHSELHLMLKGYLWTLINMKKIFEHRKLRIAHWKRVSDKKLKDIVLVRMPMPIKR